MDASAASEETLTDVLGASASDATVLLDPSWIDATAFSSARVVEVDPAGPRGANVVRVGALLLHRAEYRRTLERLRARGYDVTTVVASESAKAEGAVTGCSLVLRRASSVSWKWVSAVGSEVGRGSGELAR